MTSAETAPAASNGSGLRQILFATVIAGGLGYLIMGIVPMFTTQDATASFVVLWSATYLVVACLAGIQQEITRASRRAEHGTGARTWAIFTLSAAIVAAVVVGVVFAVVGPRVFATDTVSLVAAIVVAAFGYTLVASLSGAMYGVRAWTGVATLTITDSVLRAIAIGVALLAGGTAVLFGWAVAIPFLLAVTAVWFIVGRDVRAHLSLDASMATLARNTLTTLIGSLATGMLISGLPLLISLLAPDAGTPLLASLTYINNLTRAPLVVPILALQGFLLVQFRDAGGALIPRMLKWLAIVAGAVVVIAAVAGLFGPALMAWLYPKLLTLGAWDFVIIVLGGGLTGVMCVAGQAVLAASRHAWFTAGWVASAVATIVILVLPVDAHTRILVALLVGPAIGLAIHLIAVAAVRRAALSAR